MKIAYGTYAMPDTALEDAIPLLAEIGYDGIEICVSPKHVGSMPAEIDGTRRRTLRDLLNRYNMGIPALFLTGYILHDDEAEHRQNLEHTRRTAEMARELGMEDQPVLAMGIGGKSDRWEEQKDLIVTRLGDFADLGREEGFVMAGEAHCGAAVDRSQRATWLIETVGSPHARLHFDIVHFYLSGEDEAEAVQRLLPITAHTHITDARKHSDGSFDLLLLGDGDLDAVRYMAAMKEGGWDSYITLEVSARVWGLNDYDHIHAARYSHESLSNAFRAAGVLRD